MSPIRTRYQTIEFGDIDIHLRTLRDHQQYADPDGKAELLGISSALWPLFGVIWPSSLVMSNFLLDYNYAGKRILEVGCGIGLSSLLLNHFKADITATDYHPEVEGFLAQNVLLNDGRKIPFILSNWNDINLELGLFDLIIGSDLLYEDEHAFLLSAFIQRHANINCSVIVVDPGRGRHGKFSTHMTAAGFSYNKSKPLDTHFLKDAFAGNILEYQR